MTGSINGPAGQICYCTVIEDWEISCPIQLPLQHVPVLRTVLPQDTTLSGALYHMLALRRASGTGNSLVVGDPQPELYVMKTDHLRYPKWKAGVVQELADYMDEFVESIQTKQRGRRDETQKLTDHHKKSILAKKAKIEQANAPSTSNSQGPSNGEASAVQVKVHAGTDLTGAQKRDTGAPVKRPLAEVTNTAIRSSKRQRVPTAKVAGSTV